MTLRYTLHLLATISDIRLVSDVLGSWRRPGWASYYYYAVYSAAEVYSMRSV